MLMASSPAAAPSCVPDAVPSCQPRLVGPVEHLAALRARQADAVSTVAAALAAIDARDSRIRAFVAVDREGALAAAQDIDQRLAAGESCGPLAGVTVGVKDNIDVAGFPTSGGIGHYRDAVAAVDAPVVARLRAAGAIILGKLNMHEGALGATTDNPWFGRCENPLRPGFTPGGSSGGSAAAVAAGFCAAALGTDTLGSVRMPAAYCGVTGFKPGFGAISTEGVMPLAWTLDHVGILAPDVADVALLYGVLAQPAPRWGGIAAPAGDPAVGSALDPERVPLRVGFLSDLSPAGPESCVIDAFVAACDALRGAGVSVVPIDMGRHDWMRTRRDGFLICEIEGATIHAEALAQDPEGFSADFRAMLEFGARQSATRVAGVYRRLAQARARLQGLLEPVDLLLMPTVPQPSFRHGEAVPVNQADFTALANLLGVPALAVPWGQSPDGLPLSMQIVAPPGAEMRVLHLGAMLERLARSGRSRGVARS